MGESVEDLAGRVHGVHVLGTEELGDERLVVHGLDHVLEDCQCRYAVSVDVHGCAHCWYDLPSNTRAGIQASRPHVCAVLCTSTRAVCYQGCGSMACSMRVRHQSGCGTSFCLIIWHILRVEPLLEDVDHLTPQVNDEHRHAVVRHGAEVFSVRGHSSC